MTWLSHELGWLSLSHPVDARTPGIRRGRFDRTLPAPTSCRRRVSPVIMACISRERAMVNPMARRFESRRATVPDICAACHSGCRNAGSERGHGGANGLPGCLLRACPVSRRRLRKANLFRGRRQPAHPVPDECPARRAGSVICRGPKAGRSGAKPPVGEPCRGPKEGCPGRHPRCGARSASGMLHALLQNDFQRHWPRRQCNCASIQRYEK
jgi:hypothetical protein